MQHISKTKAYKELEGRRSEKQDKIDSYTAKLEILETYLSNEYKKIEIYFSEYTHHGWEHTIKVLDYMYDLVKQPAQLSEEEIMMMIFVALLHDIGMALDEKEAKEFIQEKLPEKNVVTEIIRAKHGEFAEKKLDKIVKMVVSDENGKNIKLRDVFKLRYKKSSTEFNDTITKVALICHSHTMQIRWIQEQWWRNDVEVVYLACLLRLADLLDADGKRTKEFRRMSSGEGYKHNLFNDIIGDVDKIKKEAETCLENCPNRINKKPCNKCYKTIILTFSVPFELDDSKKAAAWRMINSYKDGIELEIADVNSILENMEEKYHLKLFPNVKFNELHNQRVDAPQINTHRLTVDYSAIRSIMFEKEFYRNKLYGVREIVQNAYDACKAYSELKHIEREWEAKIIIIFQKSNNTIIIRDNGIGMTDYVIKEYFLNFGKSIYNFEAKYLYDDYHKGHIGHFGIGFFAAFMLSSKVIVKTQPIGATSSIKIELDENSDYATLTYKCGDMGHGTEIILDFNEVQAALGVNSADECASLMVQYIKGTFLFDGICICGRFESDEGITTTEIELANINAENSIGKFLLGINANVVIDKKEFPPIFYAKSSEDLHEIEYDDLLVKLVEYKKKSGKVYYLDAGNFLIFPGSSKIETDFEKQATDINPRRNYSYGIHLSDSISIRNDVFCKEHGLDRSLYCEYSCLDLVVRGKSAALSAIDIECARKKTVMRHNDACGEAPKDDKIYVRNVYLPSLHICLPSLNFRYNLNGVVANIKTDNVFPTIMRDTLSDEKVIELSYAIGAAITRLEIEKGVDIGENTLIIENLYNKNTKNIFIQGGDKECSESKSQS